MRETVFYLSFLSLFFLSCSADKDVSLTGGIQSQLVYGNLSVNDDHEEDASGDTTVKDDDKNKHEITDDECYPIDYVVLSDDDLWTKENSDELTQKFKDKFGKHKGYEIVSKLEDLIFYQELDLIKDEVVSSVDFDKNVIFVFHADESEIVSDHLYIRKACLNGAIEVVQDKCLIDRNQEVDGDSSMSWSFLLVEFPKDSYKSISMEVNPVKCD